MKKMMKKLLVLGIAGAMVFSLAACSDDEEYDDAEVVEDVEKDGEEGFDISQLQDTVWGVGSINGVDFEEHCAQNNLDPETGNAFWTIIDENTISIESSQGVNEFPIEVTDNGFIIPDDDPDLVIEVEYIADENVLVYTLGNAEVVVVPYE